MLHFSKKLILELRGAIFILCAAGIALLLLMVYFIRLWKICRRTITPLQQTFQIC